MALLARRRLERIIAEALALLPLMAADSPITASLRLFGSADKDLLSRVDRTMREVRTKMGRGWEQVRQPQPTP